MREGRCKGEHCGRRILWKRNRSGKLIPVDPEEVTVLTDLGEYVKGHVPHFVTCPDASQFRRADKKNPGRKQAVDFEVV